MVLDYDKKKTWTYRNLLMCIAPPLSVFPSSPLPRFDKKTNSFHVFLSRGGMKRKKKGEGKGQGAGAGTLLKGKGKGKGKRSKKKLIFE